MKRNLFYAIMEMKRDLFHSIWTAHKCNAYSKIFMANTHSQLYLVIDIHEYYAFPYYSPLHYDISCGVQILESEW